MALRSSKLESEIANIRPLNETVMGLGGGSLSEPRTSQNEKKLEVVVATDSGGWNKVCNRMLAHHLVKDANLRLRAFVPKDHPRRTELASNIELINDENLPGYSPIDLLHYSRDIDFLIMHCYGRDLEKYAQEICETKKCKWIPVVHIDWVEFVKFFEQEGLSFAGREANHQEERQKQIEICRNADLVITIGPNVAAPLKKALRPYGKEARVISIYPGLFSELNGVRKNHESQETFNVLIYADYPYLLPFFNVKGCDIAVKAIVSLQDMSYHLTIVSKSTHNVSELEQTLLCQGMQSNQFSVETTHENAPEHLAKFIRDADVLILPSRVEGFGMSGIYAISANLPVLVSGHSGVAVALKQLPSGGKHVVDSDDPLVWAQKIKEVRTMGQENAYFEAVQLRKEYMEKFIWEDQCNKLVEKMMMTNVPSEILARGPLAVKAYNKAIEHGVTRVMRVPIMIIGQQRSGKTSLKKSLTGRLFDDKEESTDGIERDPSHFSVSTEIWSTGETKQESDSAISLHNRVAHIMVSDLREEGVDLFTNTASAGNAVSTNSVTEEDSETKQDVHVAEAVEEEADLVEEWSEKPTSPIGNLLLNVDEEQSKRKLFNKEVPHTTAACVEKLLKDTTRKDEEKVYSILWDFGGQSVYYATHPIFLTGKAIYLLVYDLSKDPNDKATPVVKQGAFKRNKDRHCTKTNEDYLHLWLSSVSSLASQHMRHSESLSSGKLPKKLPPVLLVCTHADKCVPAKELARKIYGSLRCETKPYGEHLSKKYFVVDNTKSGSGEECPDVKRLREEVLAVAEQLPQMRQFIPIKWLSFEEALKYKIEKGESFISFDEARRVARDECGIDDDQQFDTLLNFLHDQRILIHFDDTPKLKNMVILDPQWLIDLFRKVITVKVYDPTADEERSEGLWRKLETEGILDEKLLQIVWGPLLNNETTENLITVMEKFSLLCRLPSVDKQYLVPSMLMSHPDEVANKLLADGFIPPLFIRFRQPRPLDYRCDATGISSVSEHLQVPLGLFPRLVIKFLQWCVKAGFKQLYKNMYQNFARFPILPKGYSAILLCHSSSIEIAVHRDPDAACENSDVTVGYNLRREIESMLRNVREECFWLNTMEYEFSVICPVCCRQRSVRYCHKHHTSGCEKEDCLHFLSETELHDEQFCRMDAFAKRTEVPVKEFVHWFRFLGMKEQAVDDFVRSYGDSLVKDLIVRNVHVMDELARRLDQPTCHGKQHVPFIQYWVHLAAEFEVPEEVVIKCQHNPESSPSKHMLEFQEGRDPDFSVQKLKEGLRAISRNDLAKKMEQCSLPDTATIRDLRVDHTESFESICLHLDHSKNWQALGQKISIPNETLQQIGTSSSCTKTVLEYIEKRNPKLTIKEMRAALTEMLRGDVCNVLDKYLQDDNTIVTLRENLNCLEEVTTLLDKETPGMRNWLHFARTFGISKDDCDYLKPKGNPRPTNTLMEYIIQVDPDLRLKTFIQTLIKMQRSDVVNVLKKVLSDPSIGKRGFNGEETDCINEEFQKL